jgi:hypothetical protein
MRLLVENMLHTVSQGLVAEFQSEQAGITGRAKT